MAQLLCASLQPAPVTEQKWKGCTWFACGMSDSISRRGGFAVLLMVQGEEGRRMSASARRIPPFLIMRFVPLDLMGWQQLGVGVFELLGCVACSSFPR